MITPLGTSRSVVSVITDTEGSLVQPMALDAGWDTGTPFQRDFLRQFLEAMLLMLPGCP